MWKVVLVDPRKTVAGPNIRPRNDRHIWDIAKSMNSIGQIEECVGEMFSGKVRIWAGIHRRNSGILICRRWNPKFLLRVQVSTRPLTPEQIIAIQLAENLHHQMSPAEEAEGIEKLYNLIAQLEGKAPSKVALARSIGRSVSKVRDALKFVSVRAEVRKMVSLGLLPYGVAVEIATLPAEKQTRWPSILF